MVAGTHDFIARRSLLHAIAGESRAALLSKSGEHGAIIFYGDLFRESCAGVHCFATRERAAPQ